MAPSKGSSTSTSGQKPHWATTAEGKRKLAEAQRKSWRARRAQAQSIKMANHDGGLIEMVRRYESLRKQIVERLGKAA